MKYINLIKLAEHFYKLASSKSLAEWLYAYYKDDTIQNDSRDITNIINWNVSRAEDIYKFIGIDDPKLKECIEDLIVFCQQSNMNFNQDIVDSYEYLKSKVKDVKNLLLYVLLQSVNSKLSVLKNDNDSLITLDQAANLMSKSTKEISDFIDFYNFNCRPENKVQIKDKKLLKSIEHLTTKAISIADFKKLYDIMYYNNSSETILPEPDKITEKWIQQLTNEFTVVPASTETYITGDNNTLNMNRFNIVLDYAFSKEVSEDDLYELKLILKRIAIQYNIDRKILLKKEIESGNLVNPGDNNFIDIVAPDDLITLLIQSNFINKHKISEGIKLDIYDKVLKSNNKDLKYQFLMSLKNSNEFLEFLGSIYHREDTYDKLFGDHLKEIADVLLKFPLNNVEVKGRLFQVIEASNADEELFKYIINHYPNRLDKMSWLYRLDYLNNPIDPSKKAKFKEFIDSSNKD